jgi:hypothetical protein
MKGSVLPGGVRDGSASIVKALNGSPRCQMTGERTIVYNFDIIYSLSSQNISIRPPFGVGFDNQPFGLPFGKWVMKTELVITNPAPFYFKLGVGQNCGGQDEGFTGAGRFLVNNGGWDQIILRNSSGTPSAAKIGTPWVIKDPGFFDLSGPDLLHLATLDFSSVGTAKFTQILPEQSEFCHYQFNPYLFSEQLYQFVTGGIRSSLWVSGLNAIAELGGWGFNGAGVLGYPNRTKLGTLKFTFARAGQTPLFTGLYLPPRSVQFTNVSFFNPDLNPVWDWNFGDGSAHSALQTPPPHNYGASGKYTVTLRMTDDTLTAKTFDQVVDLSLKADFTFSTRPSFNNGPVTLLHVVDISLGAVSWDWDWGDGSAHGTTQNISPDHFYPRGQHFTVTLTVGDGAGNHASVSKVVNT